MKKIDHQSLTIDHQLKAMRHSCEHVLTQAMYKLFPGIKMAMGPATDEGFYFDFDPTEYKISEADFPKIETEMKKIIKENLTIKKKVLSIKEARKLFKGNPYKQAWLDEISLRQDQGKKEEVTVYWTGKEFVDLCSGPHLKSTGKIGAFKLLSLAGAYWRGDEKNKMLTRIYGTCFPNQEELDKYLWQREEAKKRDHRVLGKKLDLFSFHKEAPGDVFWHPKGYQLMLSLFEFWRQIHRAHGYFEVRTPEILTRQAWDQSGHTNFFMEKIYRVLTPDAKRWDMAIKPMNCDGGILIYKDKPRSYRDLPIRMGEIGVVHRYEAPGELHGIIRPREFTQDDAHIYCTPQQVKAEIKGVMDLCFKVYEVFGLKLDHLELSTQPENSIGSDKVWKEAEKIMRQILKEKGVPHQVNKGEGAFYGPKIDFHLKDSVGRTWQCATIQLDFAQPENFDLSYITPSGTKERPVMIHRVIYGSVERFLGILIEHYAGAFPIWLSPIQVLVIPIADRHWEYAERVKARFLDENLRAQIDRRSETMQKKIKEAEEQKIPYMVVVGDREIKEKNLSVRKRSQAKLEKMSLEKFLGMIKKEIEEKR